MKAETEDLPPSNDIQASHVPVDSYIPKTAVGMMAHISQDRLRINELEAQILAEGGNANLPTLNWHGLLKDQLIQARNRIAELETMLAAKRNESINFLNNVSTLGAQLMDSDLNIDLDIALRQFHKLAFEDGDIAAEYWTKIARLLKSAKEYRDRALAAEDALRRLNATQKTQKRKA